jgi:DNA (cytosine-5)-methyltransferase 1
VAKTGKDGGVNEPTHVDLFSGIGGFALAAQWAGFRTVAFCEIDKYCQKILAKNFLADSNGRQRVESHGQIQTRWNAANGCYSDIQKLDGTAYRGCDLITGGFPCQPFSVAGKRGGAADDRAIWPEMFRVISEARPAWVLGENVPGIIPMELDNVLSDLESIGYATRAFVIPACAVDARHRRDRLWIVGRNVADAKNTYGWRANRAHNGGRGDKEIGRCGQQGRGFQHWLPEPAICRVAHGIRSRVDRLKGLGNAIVPQVAYEILREIRKLIC